MSDILLKSKHWKRWSVIYQGSQGKEFSFEKINKQWYMTNTPRKNEPNDQKAQGRIRDEHGHTTKVVCIIVPVECYMINQSTN